MLTTSKTQDLINLMLYERIIEFVKEKVQDIQLVRSLKSIPTKLVIARTPAQSVQIGASNYIGPMLNSETLYNKDS